MKLSVCMATRNGERYLPGQLNSILSQLGPEDELVISDDSSTDGTLDIVRALADPRIRLLENNRFFSPIYNFENTLRHASGQFIALADQDDLWLGNKAEVIRQHLAGKRNRPKLIMMDGYIVNAAGIRTGQTMFTRKPPRKGVIGNLYDNTFTGCALAFDRALLEIALPFPAGIPMHDSWLGMLALLCGEVEFVDLKTMEYRRHGANLSKWQRNPWVQIRWRLCLAYHLIKRYASWRRTDKSS